MANNIASNATEAISGANHKRAQPSTACIMLEFAVPELFDCNARRREGQLDKAHAGVNGREITR